MLAAKIETPVGKMQAVIEDNYLVALLWPEVEDVRFSSARPARSKDALQLINQLQQQLDEYFRLQRLTFELPLAPHGTAFQRQVWEALSDIPYGQTRTYGQQAMAIGRPKAARAVGAANGKNPLSIVVPCHRVIGSNGKLTGFAGGLAAKRYLLALESRGRNPGPTHHQLGIQFTRPRPNESASSIEGDFVKDDRPDSGKRSTD